VTLGRFLYSPEGIALAITPTSALGLILAAAQAATREVTGTSGIVEDMAWAPHLTVCYSTGEQTAAPVIAELGKAIPGCEVTIDRLSLVDAARSSESPRGNGIWTAARPSNRR
jgi:hypothetical protein